MPLLQTTLARSLTLFRGSLCRRRKKSAQGTTGRGTPLPVVHNALTKTQAESLGRRECNRLVFRVFEFPRLLPIRKEKGNATPLKTIFNIVEQSESDKVI